MAINFCLKNSPMNYNPLLLNDTAIRVIKKTDSALYGIQLALVQATRPIDYYVHRRIQENLGLNTVEDPATMFASTIGFRCTPCKENNGKETTSLALFSSISASTNKASFSNKTSDNQAKFFGKGYSQGKKTSDQASVIFTISDTDITSKLIQKKIESRSKHNSNRRSCIPFGKKYNRKSSNQIPDDIPIQSPPLWPVSKPIGIYQDFLSSSLMGQKTMHQNICIYEQSTDSGKIQESVDLRTEACKMLNFSRKTLRFLASFIEKAQTIPVALLPECLLELKSHYLTKSNS
ncbi:hypothetical protein BB561_000686 [Smittium simulii]|uniref:Uncharacterized protein n=1 Tax=Smittium simulii TaxID=133385 RepID=A0A2T9YY09_9FUNG|nr:hypothetical protein BB561_000686 [Smittium simulii]